MSETTQQEFSNNRSMPSGVIIPELAYPDVCAAVEWIGIAFGFVERLRIGNHRAQLVFGDSSIVVTEQRSGVGSDRNHSLMVRVADADAHCKRAGEAGAKILNPPADYPYGERQYTVEDLGGHVWTLSQTIADVDPASWGGVLDEAFLQ